MQVSQSHQLKPGIISVLQTPFTPSGDIDNESLISLIEDAIRSGVEGFLVPAVASEVEYLTVSEREEIVRLVAKTTQQRVPIIVGASANDLHTSKRFADLAVEVEAAAYLVAVPDELYATPEKIPAHFKAISATSEIPLLIQDLQWNGPGLELNTIRQLRDELPNLIGLKIETVPAGPKYSEVRKHLGNDFFIAGGWAVPQWIEALDRGIDAMIPESSMIRVYAGILAEYRAGRRDVALRFFRQLLPLLTYTNQEIATSIAFFKRLLVRRGIIKHEEMRMSGFTWDSYNSRVGEELIELYLGLENQFPKPH